MFLHYLETIFKNPAFREEREWRIIYFPRSVLTNTWEKPSAVTLTDDEDAADIRFRTSDNDVIPFFAFPRSADITSAIKGISLGPLNRSKDFPLALFLRKYGASDFQIHRSVASLR